MADQYELIKINELDETGGADDDSLLALGDDETGVMKKISFNNFSASTSKKVIGNTDISGIGDGTVSGAISDNYKNILANSDDIVSLGSDLADLQNTTNSLSDDIANLSSALDSKADISEVLIYKGDYTDDYDDLGFSDSGIYYINGRTVATSSTQWGYLIHLAQGGIRYQLFFPSASSIYFRYYAGNPATWSGWRVISGTSV